MATLNGSYEEYTLENGLRVALQRTPTETIAGQLRFDFGASDEMPGEEGMAHLLEHVLGFGSSKKFDLDQSKKIRGTFGKENAYTDPRRTTFDVELLREDFELWIDWVSNQAFEPVFDAKTLHQEKVRVCREISDAISKPDHLFNQRILQRLYRGHPAATWVLGREEVVSAASEETIGEFHQRGFSPSVADLILVGNLPDDVDRSIRTYFEKYHSNRNPRKVLPELSLLDGRTILVRHAKENLKEPHPETSSAEVYLSSVVPLTVPDRYALKILNKIYGVGEHSVLFREVSQVGELAYQAQSQLTNAYNTSVLLTYAKVSANRIGETIDLFFRCMDELKQCRMDDLTYERIRHQIEFSAAKDLETNEGHVRSIERRLDTGRTPEEELEGLHRITPDDVLETARKYLPARDGNYVLAVEDPLGKFDAKNFR